MAATALTAHSPRVLTVAEAAELLGISTWQAHHHIRRDGALAGVPVIRLGKRIYLPRAAFERVLDGEAVADGNA